MPWWWHQGVPTCHNGGTRVSKHHTIHLGCPLGVPTCPGGSIRCPLGVPPNPLTPTQRQPQQHGAPAPLGVEERGEAGADAELPAVPGEHPPAQAVHRDVGHLGGG